MVIVGLSTIFSGLGVAPAIVQRPELEQRHVRVGFTLSVMFSLIVAGLVWAGAPALAALFRLPELTPVVQGTSLVFICQGFAMVAYALAQRALRFRWLATVHAVRSRQVSWSPAPCLLGRDSASGRSSERLDFTACCG